MANIRPFELFPDEYDEWFTKHRAEYEMELRAVSALLPVETEKAVVPGFGEGSFVVLRGKMIG